MGIEEIYNNFYIAINKWETANYTEYSFKK
jgi:hypothetical protein